jgi:hypothetical protein
VLLTAADDMTGGEELLDAFFPNKEQVEIRRIAKTRRT